MKKKWFAFLIALTMGLTMMVGQARAEIMLSPGTIGDVLLFSLYDLRDNDFRTPDWDNFLVIENTSGNWTAVHLRFREYKKSIEVWDHVILLSPYDMFWADLKRTPVDGGVTIWSNDENTLRNSGLYYDTPAVGGRLWQDTFKTDLMEQCGFPADLSEIEMGEVEVIGLWSLTIPVKDAGDPNKLPNGIEDTHVLGQVVRDVFQSDFEAANSFDFVNVFDVMFALYYEWVPGVDPGCEGDPQDHTDLYWNAGWETYADANVLINTCEAPQDECTGAGDCDGKPRYALDCANVLTGAYEMGDVGNGRYELQNFVVFRNFRTDQAGWTTGRTLEANGLHRDRFGGGEIVYPPTVWSTDITKAVYTGPTAAGRFSGAVAAPIPAYYFNESWTSTAGPGLRDGDNILGPNAQQPLMGIDPFNDIWSLDDVENAIAKDDVWFHYFLDFFYAPGTWDYRYRTEMSVSFPTKHYHWFFIDFPYWRQPDKSINDYVGDLASYRSDIFWAFDFLFDNGEVRAVSRIWNDNEDLFNPIPTSQPSPVTHYNRLIPHEVNYVTVQSEDEGGLLYIDPAKVNLTTGDYTVGHFQISDIVCRNGERNVGFGEVTNGPVHPIYKIDNSGKYKLYPVGAVTFLNYQVDGAGDPLVGGLVRSTLSKWHFTWSSIHPVVE